MNEWLLFVVVFFITLFVYFKFKKGRNLDTTGMDVLYHLESPYQTIDLVRDVKTNHIAMFLNGEIQNHTKEYKKSHYEMVDVSIKLLDGHPKNILILGGGDGYPAMRALKYDGVRVKNVELDDTLIRFVQTNPIMRKLSEDAFNNPNLELIAMDAYEYIHKEKEKFDIIVYDVELNTNNIVTEFDHHHDHILENLLSKNGVINMTGHLGSSEIGNGFSKICENYINTKKEYDGERLIALLQTKDDFDIFDTYFPMNIKKLKHLHPNSEIGISIYDLNSFCGNYQYRDEIYFYISKEPFNKTNSDVKFYPFRKLC
jgi:spermidine synthase